MTEGPNYQTAWEALSKPLSWMHDSDQLKSYWGWNLADIANDLIDKAYPGLRSGNALSPAALATQPATSQPEETWMNDSRSLDAGLPATSQEGEGTGWGAWNPDSGEEYTSNHPFESGECVEAERIRRSTPQEDTLWQGMQEQFMRAEALTAALAATPTPLTLSEDLREALRAWEPEGDDRVRPLLLAEADRRDALEYNVTDANHVISFLLHRLDAAIARAQVKAS